MKPTNFFPKILALCFFPIIFFNSLQVSAQSDTPCECSSRWEEGGHWNPDGTINESGNIPSPQGIIRCGNSADTQSNVSSCVSPGAASNINCDENCVYDSNSFEIDLSGITCFDPNNPGVDPGVNAPADGCDII